MLTTHSMFPLTKGLFKNDITLDGGGLAHYVTPIVLEQYIYCLFA